MSWTSGTTTYALSRLLSARQKPHSHYQFAPYRRRVGPQQRSLYLHDRRTSGERGREITTGSFASSFLDNFASIDLFLCGADGISVDMGITEYNESVADIKRRLTALASRTILLADHSKFGKKSLFRCCSAEDIDTLITDSQTPQRYLDIFQKAGATVMTVTDDPV